MKRNFNSHLQQLKNLLGIYTAESAKQKEELIKSISKQTLKVSNLLEYHECLLFIVAYPSTQTILQLVNKEFNRIAHFLKLLSNRQKELLLDTGLPYTKMTTRFSCDILYEMIYTYQCIIEMDSFEEDGMTLNSLLNLTLPSVLKQETTAGLDNIALLDTLGVKPKQRLTFLINEFNKLDHQPLVKDHLWESMKIYLNISPGAKSYARCFNKIPCPSIFFHENILKNFDEVALLQKPLPNAVVLNKEDAHQVIACIRKSLLLTMRETDTSTYMDTNSLQLFHLERGISIGLYSLKTGRQLAYQSYIGYTAFKNGYPIAYGGSWIFGHSAMFGLNILESFRGGESGFLMCQLLRTYIQRYELSYIEVENYQFGKDNPDGIKSGAFWFYYRYGFRPIDAKLNRLAQNESTKIKKQFGYRSSEKTLIALSESNIALNLMQKPPIKKEYIFDKVLKMIANEFGGNNCLARDISIEEFKIKLGAKVNLKDVDIQTLEEVALWAKAFKVTDQSKIKLLYEMILVKPHNAYDFNQLIKEFLVH
jgi:hypothetical protein